MWIVNAFQRRLTPRVWAVGGLIVIMAVGAFVRFDRLGANGVGNAYYAAAVKSMLTSWHNFFYVAFEPGGSVSVDKPPLGLWLQAIPAGLWGVNGFTLALPQALAGLLAIPLLYSLVKSPFGTPAGLLAALVLAVTPVTVVVERNNTMDGTLVLALLLAAWAVWKSVRTGRMGYLLLGAVWVGIGFNIKMLQAWMVLPALYGLYFFGARCSWKARLGHLALATLVMGVLSLAWVVAVDLTPASERPYVSSSSNNTVIELIIGHNGLRRLGLEDNAIFGQPSGAPVGPPPGGNLPGAYPQNPGNAAGGSTGAGDRPGYVQPPYPGNPPGGYVQPGYPVNPGGYAQPVYPVDPPGGYAQPPLPDNPSGSYGQPGYPANPLPGGGANRVDEVGVPGLARLFVPPLASQASWLLPLALLGGLAALWAAGWPRPLNEQHQALLLWGGWLLPMVIYFSYNPGLWHSYYLIMLGPGIAALAGAALWALDRLEARSRRVGLALAAGLSGVTAAFEVWTFWTYPGAIAVALGTLAAWLVGMGLLAWGRRRGWAAVVLCAGLLLAPFVFSVQTALNPGPDVNLPKAGPGNARGPVQGPVPVPGGNFFANSLDDLLANTPAGSYLLATTTANEAAPFILATGRPVLTFGGFSGGDNIINAPQFAQWVAAGKVRYVLSGEALARQKPQIDAWVRRNCRTVRSDGVRTLYDCAPRP